MKIKIFLWTALMLSAPGYGSNLNCDVVADNWPLDYSLGDEDINVDFYADLDLLRTCNSVSGIVNVGAMGSFYELKAELVEGLASANLFDYDQFSVESELNILGMVVDELDYNFSTEVSYSDRLGFPVTLSNIQVFMVGPVPVDVEYGIFGEGGLEYYAGLAAGRLAMEAVPFVETGVFASGGVDAVIVAVELRGDLILINDSFHNELSLELDLANLNRVFFTGFGTNELSALDGKIRLLTRTGVPPFASTHENEIFAWQGYDYLTGAYDISEEIFFN